MKKVIHILFTLSLLPVLSLEAPAATSLMAGGQAQLPFSVLVLASAPKPIPSPGHSKPPQPISPKPHFSYWRNLWDNGASTDEAFLSGDWKLVGQAATSGCNTDLADEYNKGGIKNDDGSESSLHFAQFPSGPDHQTTFGVQIMGLGSKKANQGPFAVDAVEPQFSTWAYQTDRRVPSSKFYFEWSCRANSKTEASLICMIHLRSNQGDSCAEDAEGIVLAYLKR